MRHFILILVLSGLGLILAQPAQAHSAEKWRTVGTTWNGLGIQANQYTSTSFARHAGMAAARFTKTIRVYSNARKRFIVMRCSGGNSSYRPRTCRGGSYAAVRLAS